MITELPGHKKLIVIAGPTASGKTSFALKIAKEVAGEIINADSRQIYKYADIGTNKGILTQTNKSIKLKGYKSEAYRIEDTEIIGWLFNLVDPDYQLSVAEYQNFANTVINRIWDNGKLPILVGGTGLYIDAVIKGYKLDLQESDDREILNQLSLEQLQERLILLDKMVFNNLNNSDRKNPRRLVRLIEKIESGSHVKANETKVIIDNLFLYPELTKTNLYANINERVLKMLDEGLIEEVQDLLNRYPDSHIFTGIGYKEVVKFLDGSISKAEMTEQIQQGHRNYAKRQMTWFENKNRGYNIHTTDFTKLNQKIINYLKT